MAPPPPFSSDLILHILDFVRYDSCRTPRAQSQDLRSLSLVTPRWSREAQLLLFRNIELSTAEKVDAFIAATESNSSLGEAVRTLKVSVTSVSGGCGRSPSSNNRRKQPEAFTTQEQLVAMLASTPLLYELDLSLSQPSVSEATLDALRAMSCRPRALRFTNNSWDSYGENSKALYQLLEIWGDSLEFLVIAGNSYCLLTPPPSGQRLTSKLKEFQWSGFDKPSDEIMDYFLSHSISSLRYLSLKSLPSTPTLTQLLQSHGPYLRSLKMRDTFGLDKSSLKFCTTLEEFAIDRGMTADLIQDHLIKDSLVHLEFGVKSSGGVLGGVTGVLRESDALVQGLKDVEMPKLKRVTQKDELMYRSAVDEERMMERWRPICAKGDVKVVLSGRKPQVEVRIPF